MRIKLLGHYPIGERGPRKFKFQNDQIAIINRSRCNRRVHIKLHLQFA